MYATDRSMTLQDRTDEYGSTLVKLPHFFLTEAYSAEDIWTCFRVQLPRTNLSKYDLYASYI